MRVNKWLWVMVSGIVIGGSGIVTYALHKKHQDNEFNCVASFSQHYSHESFDISLNYMMRGDSGVVSINGHSREDAEKVFSRKISFHLRQEGDLYYLVSDKNIKLPDDSMDDNVLSQYEPQFFVYPDKEFYIRIVRQKNDNYIFMVDSIPTYVCKVWDNAR